MVMGPVRAGIRIGGVCLWYEFVVVCGGGGGKGRVCGGSCGCGCKKGVCALLALLAASLRRPSSPNAELRWAMSGVPSLTI